jgi:DNA-binding NtrC family response regulator
MTLKPNILIVDDEPNSLKVLSAILEDEGYEVRQCRDCESAMEAISRDDMDAVITDLRMPGKDGMELFEYVREARPGLPVIFLTAFGTVESAVNAIVRGAFYYLIKPPDYAQLKGILARAVEQRRGQRELENLKNGPNGVPRLIGKSSHIQKIRETVESVKESASSVLVYGETGTGKEVVARALHFGSSRKDLPFVVVNCAAIPRELMEAELFGYEKGAFTGAAARRTGRFEEAAGGTLFLDEISELELGLQSKLLRVLQEREIERLGSNKRTKVKFRLISSTNRELSRLVREGRFREDLYYRVNVVEIRIPPLRDRKDDLPFLIQEFLAEFSQREKKDLVISDEVMNIFQRYGWPGNVRQLKNSIERAVVLARGDTITPRELPQEFASVRKKIGMHLSKTLREIELQAVRHALSECRGNKSRAAKLLGISRKAFYKRLKEN